MLTLFQNLKKLYDNELYANVIPIVSILKAAPGGPTSCQYKFPFYRRLVKPFV